MKRESDIRRPGRVGGEYAVRIASRLTDRDRRIALDCYDHRVLTTEQLRRLHFARLRTAQRRLEQLYELRVLDRFRPAWRRGEGSTPYHWLLDEAGAYVVAARLGRSREELGWRHDVAIASAGSSTLTHQREVNDFFTLLALEARAAGGALREWWGERRAAQALSGIARPDGYGRLELPGTGSTAFLLELDRGTEPHARLREKARRYAKALARSGLRDRAPVIILALPSTARAAAAGEALATSMATVVPVAWSARAPTSPLTVVLDAARTQGHRLTT